MDTIPAGYQWVETDAFTRWMNKLKDVQAKAAILRRLEQAERGNLGDRVAVGQGVVELRVHVGPGYRVYFCRVGRKVHVLLVGGTKATQQRDIAQAKAIAGMLQENV